MRVPDRERRTSELVRAIAGWFNGEKPSSIGDDALLRVVGWAGDGVDEEIHKRNVEHSRKENLKLQEQLLAAQERVYELQGKLLSLREIVNS